MTYVYIHVIHLSFSCSPHPPFPISLMPFAPPPPHNNNWWPSIVVRIDPNAVVCSWRCWRYAKSNGGASSGLIVVAPAAATVGVAATTAAVRSQSDLLPYPFGPARLGYIIGIHSPLSLLVTGCLGGVSAGYAVCPPTLTRSPRYAGVFQAHHELPS